MLGDGTLFPLSIVIARLRRLDPCAKGNPLGVLGGLLGDVIIVAGNTRSSGDTALPQAMAAARPGQQVTPTVTRGGRDPTVHVALGKLPGG